MSNASPWKRSRMFDIYKSEQIRVLCGKRAPLHGLLGHQKVWIHLYVRLKKGQCCQCCRTKKDFSFLKGTYSKFLCLEVVLNLTELTETIIHICENNFSKLCWSSVLINRLSLPITCSSSCDANVPQAEWSRAVPPRHHLPGNAVRRPADLHHSRHCTLWVHNCPTLLTNLWTQFLFFKSLKMYVVQSLEKQPFKEIR